MKKAMFSMLAASLILASCSDDDSGSNGTITAQALTNTITNGSWRVTYFEEDGVDHTSDFDGFNFTFDDNNTVSASNGTDSYDGIWTIVPDDSDGDNNPNNNPDFNLAFPSPEVFAELTEDWQPTHRTGNKIQLRHENDDDQSVVDYLTLERNTN